MELIVDESADRYEKRERCFKEIEGEEVLEALSVARLLEP